MKSKHKIQIQWKFQLLKKGKLHPIKLKEKGKEVHY